MSRHLRSGLQAEVRNSDAPWKRQAMRRTVRNRLHQHLSSTRRKERIMANSIVYRGTPGGRVMRQVVGPDGTVVSEDELRHLVKHSPTGFSWGYGGSGPADLALSILRDV